MKAGVLHVNPVNFGDFARRRKTRVRCVKREFAGFHALPRETTVPVESVAVSDWKSDVVQPRLTPRFGGFSKFVPRCEKSPISTMRRASIACG